MNNEPTNDPWGIRSNYRKPTVGSRAWHDENKAEQQAVADAKKAKEEQAAATSERLAADTQAGNLYPNHWLSQTTESDTE